MKPRTKFLIGGAARPRIAGYLMASSISETGHVLRDAGRAGHQARRPTRRFTARASSSARASSRARSSAMPGGREYAFVVTDGAKTFRCTIAGIAPTRSPTAWTSSSRAAGPGRHLPGDDAAREVRVALRERAREVRRHYKRRRDTRRGRPQRVILIGELSLWVALLMAAWSATVSFAGGVAAPR